MSEYCEQEIFTLMASIGNDMRSDEYCNGIWAGFLTHEPKCRA